MGSSPMPPRKEGGGQNPTSELWAKLFPLSAKLLSSPTPREKEQRSEELIILFPRRKNTHFPFSFQPGTVESSTTPTFFYSPFSVFRWEDLPPSPPTLRAKEIPVSLIAAASLCQVEGPVRRETPFKKEVVDQVQNGLRTMEEI